MCPWQPGGTLGTAWGGIQATGSFGSLMGWDLWNFGPDEAGHQDPYAPTRELIP